MMNANDKSTINQKKSTRFIDCPTLDYSNKKDPAVLILSSDTVQ
jgi:hypothetical protein